MVMPYKNADDHIAIDKGTFVDAYNTIIWLSFKSEFRWIWFVNGNFDTKDASSMGQAGRRHYIFIIFLWLYRDIDPTDSNRMSRLNPDSKDVVDNQSLTMNECLVKRRQSENIANFSVEKCIILFHILRNYVKPQRIILMV